VVAAQSRFSKKARFDGEWKITNMLWELKPFANEEESQTSGSSGRRVLA
jgi:hypothetical protein